MPPPRDFNEIARIRDALAASDRAAADAARELAAIRLRREEAVRAGATRTALGRLATAERDAQSRHRDAVLEGVVHRDRLPALVEALADPEVALARLESAVPVAMLPVRIETRFEGRDRLRVRIYPDQIHLQEHDAAVTPAEVAAGKRYWTRAWAGGESADRAWREIVASLRPERAAYLVDRLRPANAGGAPRGEPEFPRVETVALRSPITAEARLLPTRWLVTLFAPDGKRMGRKWSGFVPERLAVSPFGDLLADEVEDSDDELPIDDAARWMVDFERAEQVGMALTIDQSDLETGRLADGIGRLVVVGVDWTRTPESAAEALLDQLCGHGYADGLELLGQGTATNNTAWRGSDFRSNDRARGTAFPAVPPAEAPPQSGAERLSFALGLGDGSRLARFPGAGASYEATVAAVHGAIWGASFGFYLSEVLRPILSDATVALVRRHVAQYVRPAGPMPTLRIGRQPYGVVPVLSTPVVLSSLTALESIGSGFERELAVTLSRMRRCVETPMLNGVSERVLDKIPTMAGVPPGVKPEDHLADILKLGPLSTSVEVRPTAGVWRHETGEPLTKAEQAHINAALWILSNCGVKGSATGMGGQLVDMFVEGENQQMVRPKLLDFVSPDRPRYSLNAIPWVAADLASADAVRQVVEKAQARIAAAVADPKRIKSLLSVAAEDAGTLFEGLLFLSAAFEYWRAGEQVARDSSRETIHVGSLVSELVGIAAVEPPGPSFMAVETPRQLLQLEARTVAGTTSTKSLLAHVHDRIFADHVIAPLQDARMFHDALDELAERPAHEVDHALRGLIDLGSHRLDAWITSVATRRLSNQRSARPAGVHIGGYGLVHDLAPDVTPDSEGYVHVPSGDHAIAAAVLRAGHMANRDDQPEAFAIRLTSERVRNALYITEGMAQGQRVSALLGYRFERWLVEGRHQAKYINAFRRFAPHATDPTPAAGPQEAIAARDVVDGQRLAEQWRERRDAVFTDLAPLMEPPLGSVPADDRTALGAALDQLVDLFDAFLDLWTSESVYQLARGNPERAGAALAVIDRQDRPPEPQSVETPRAAWGYVQRVMWTLPATETAEGWPEDVVSRVEPGANALAALLIGDPERFEIGAHAVSADGTPLARPRLSPIGLSDLELSPLSLAMLSEPTGRDQPSRLEERIAAVFADTAVAARWCRDRARARSRRGGDLGTGPAPGASGGRAAVAVRPSAADPAGVHRAHGGSPRGDRHRPGDEACRRAEGGAGRVRESSGSGDAQAGKSQPGQAA